MQASLSDWIVSNSEILGGKPCVRGTRLSVAFLLELTASGASSQQILERYPHLPPEGLAAAYEYAARVLRSDVIWDLPISA
ncbi:MAG: DUF433 domain-containing protein [Acidobacteriota bacterium]